MSKSLINGDRTPSAGLRILVTDTNRWPVAARLVIAFRKKQCEMAVLCSTPDHPVQKLRGVGPIYSYDGFEPIRSLRKAIESFNPDLVVPCCDRGVGHLHALHAIARSEGEAGAKLAGLIEHSLGSPAGFEVVSSRMNLIEAAEAEGIPVPKTASIESGADLAKWAAEIETPWVLKADGTWGGRGVTVVNDPGAAKRFIQQFDRQASVANVLKRILLNRDRDWALFDWKHSKRPVIAQSLIEGRPANCAVVCWQGKVLAGVAVEVIKACGATGPATIVQVVPGSEMIEAAQKLARRLGISGFFGLDFVIDNKTGVVYLIEMNPRCTPPSPLSFGDGRDLVQALCAQLTGKVLPATSSTIQHNVIAYFPLGVKSLESEGGLQTASIYRDIPADEPELVAALLHPKSRRTFIGRLLDRLHRKETGDVRSVAFSVDQAAIGKR
jgi:pyruvate carboxylase